MKTLEQHMTDLLKEIDPLAEFTVAAHEMMHDGTSWSSNDMFRISSCASLALTIEAMRGRWEVFKANYSRRARVQDIAIVSDYDDRLLIEADCMPLFDVTVQRASWQVIVGNIGTIYDGTNFSDAAAEYEAWIKQSQSGQGRAAYEEVTLMGDDDVYREFIPRSYYTITPAKPYKQCWAHHPRGGGRVTGYATRIRDGLYSKERGISMSAEAAKVGICFASYPVNQVMAINPEHGKL